MTEDGSAGIDVVGVLRAIVGDHARLKVLVVTLDVSHFKLLTEAERASLETRTPVFVLGQEMVTPAILRVRLQVGGERPRTWGAETSWSRE